MVIFKSNHANIFVQNTNGGCLNCIGTRYLHTIACWWTLVCLSQEVVSARESVEEFRTQNLTHILVRWTRKLFTCQCYYKICLSERYTCSTVYCISKSQTTSYTHASLSGFYDRSVFTLPMARRPWPWLTTLFDQIIFELFAACDWVRWIDLLADICLLIVELSPSGWSNVHSVTRLPCIWNPSTRCYSHGYSFYDLIIFRLITSRQSRLGGEHILRTISWKLKRWFLNSGHLPKIEQCYGDVFSLLQATICLKSLP